MALSRPQFPAGIQAQTQVTCGVDALFIVRTLLPTEFNEAMYICSVCMCLPRMPVSIGCRHIFCEHCIRGVLVTANSGFFPIGSAGCPMCRKQFTSSKILPFENWPGVATGAFDRVQVRCPRAVADDSASRCEDGWFLPVDCGFSGSIAALKTHENTACPNRIIRCPNAQCGKSGTAHYVEQHFATCKLLKVFCRMCGLAKFDSLGLHNCIEALQWQLRSTFHKTKRFMCTCKLLLSFYSVCRALPSSETAVQENLAARSTRRNLHDCRRQGRRPAATISGRSRCDIRLN